MSHTDEPASTTPPASTRNPVRKRDAILDARHRYHRAVGAIVAATAALWLNGALLSGFDTIAPPLPTVTHRHSSQFSARLNRRHIAAHGPGDHQAVWGNGVHLIGMLALWNMSEGVNSRYGKR